VGGAECILVQTGRKLYPGSWRYRIYPGSDRDRRKYLSRVR